MTAARIALAVEGALVWLTAGALFLATDHAVEAAVDGAFEAHARLPTILLWLDYITPVSLWGLVHAALIAAAYLAFAGHVGPSPLRIIAWSLATFAAFGLLCFVAYWSTFHVLLDGSRPVPVQRMIGNLAVAAIAAAAAWWAWIRLRKPRDDAPVLGRSNS